MKTISLSAVREQDLQNRPGCRRYRSQVLGSILLWAYRANATRIVYDPVLDTPFLYFDAEGASIISEFSQPPQDLKGSLTKALFLDTVDGHPILRPFRRLFRRLQGQNTVAIMKVPDLDHNIESMWQMSVGKQTTEFELLDTVLLEAANERDG